MSAQPIPKEGISHIDFLSVKVLYSNSVGITIMVGSEKYLFSGQPISLIERSKYFETVFSKIDFRFSPIAIFDDSEITSNLLAFTSIWSYINGALEIHETFKGHNYTELIQMLPYIEEFSIKSKAFYDAYLSTITGFSNYDNYEVGLMRSATPRLIIELDTFFENDRTLANYWKQKLATGLANLEGPNTNLASISIKPIENKMPGSCEIIPLSNAPVGVSNNPNLIYIPTLRSPSKFVNYGVFPNKNNF